MKIKRLIELIKADKDGRCIIFEPNYDIISIYYPPDKDDEEQLYIKRVTGVIKKEEYDEIRGDK